MAIEPRRKQWLAPLAFCLAAALCIDAASGQSSKSNSPRNSSSRSSSSSSRTSGSKSSKSPSSIQPRSSIKIESGKQPKLSVFGKVKNLFSKKSKNAPRTRGEISDRDFEDALRVDRGLPRRERTNSEIEAAVMNDIADSPAGRSILMTRTDDPDVDAPPPNNPFHRGSAIESLDVIDFSSSTAYPLLTKDLSGYLAGQVRSGDVDIQRMRRQSGSSNSLRSASSNRSRPALSLRSSSRMMPEIVSIEPLTSSRQSSNDVLPPLPATPRSSSSSSVSNNRSGNLIGQGGQNLGVMAGMHGAPFIMPNIQRQFAPGVQQRFTDIKSKQSE